MDWRNLDQVAELGIGKSHQRVAGEAVLLPVIQNVQFDAAVVGQGLPGT